MVHNKNLRIAAAIFFACVFWGFSFVWTKKVLQVYTPVTTVLLRLVFSSFFLVIAGFAFKMLQRLQRKDIKEMLLLTLFQPFLYFIGENYGVSLVSSTVAAVLVSTIPLFTPIAARYFFNERVTWMNIAGILVSIIGVILVIVDTTFSFSASTAGILFLVLAVASAIAYSVVAKRITDKYNVFSIIAYQNFIGIFYFLPFFLIFDYKSFIQITPSTDIILSVLQLAFFASTLAFMFFTYSIKMIGITKSNMFTNAIPVFTAIFSYFIFDEKLLLINIIGIITVISGLTISQLKRPNGKKRLKAKHATTVSKY